MPQLLSLAALFMLFMILACSGPEAPSAPASAPSVTSNETAGATSQPDLGLTPPPDMTEAPNASPEPTPAPTSASTASPEPTPAPTSASTASPEPTSAPTAAATDTINETVAATSKPGPASMSLRDVLDASNAAMQALGSAHVFHETNTTVRDTVVLFVRLDGDYQAPDSFQYTVETGFGSVSHTMEFIFTGSGGLRKDPASGSWTADPESKNTFPLLSPDGDPSEGFTLVYNPEVFDGFRVALGELEGERIYHLKGNPPAETVSEAMAALQMAVLGYGPNESSFKTTEVEVEYWIGVEDLLVRKARGLFGIESRNPNTGSLDTVKTESVVMFSDHNKPVNIQTP